MQICCELVVAGNFANGRSYSGAEVGARDRERDRAGCIGDVHGCARRMVGGLNRPFYRLFGKQAGRR